MNIEGNRSDTKHSLYVNIAVIVHLHYIFTSMYIGMGIMHCTEMLLNSDW